MISMCVERLLGHRSDLEQGYDDANARLNFQLRGSLAKDCLSAERDWDFFTRRTAILLRARLGLGSSIPQFELHNTTFHLNTADSRLLLDHYEFSFALSILS